MLLYLVNFCSGLISHNPWQWMYLEEQEVVFHGQSGQLPASCWLCACNGADLCLCQSLCGGSAGIWCSWLTNFSMAFIQQSGLNKDPSSVFCFSAVATLTKWAAQAPPQRQQGSLGWRLGEKCHSAHHSRSFLVWAAFQLRGLLTGADGTHETEDSFFCVFCYVWKNIEMRKIRILLWLLPMCLVNSGQDLYDLISFCRNKSFKHNSCSSVCIEVLLFSESLVLLILMDSTLRDAAFVWLIKDAPFCWQKTFGSSLKVFL